MNRAMPDPEPPLHDLAHPRQPSSLAGGTAAAAATALPAIDLALRLETGDGQPLPAALADLLAGGAALTGAEAEEHWRSLLSLWLADLAAELPEAWRAPAYSLGLLLTDDTSIAALNGSWRQRPEPTDVLAFAALEAGEGDALPCPPPGVGAPQDADEPLELGDIVISLQTAARQAEASGGSLPQELLFLASHGLLHLLGWDHPDEEALEAMLRRQALLIKDLET